MHYLRERKVELVQVNPMHTKRLKELQGNSPNKTDKKDPTPQGMRSHSLTALARTLKKVSCGKLGRERAKALYEGARNSVGMREGRDRIVFEIEELLSTIEACECFISRAEKRISNYLKEVPYSKYILSMKGIGEITTAGLIGEVGDFNKFSRFSELENLVGFNLFEISSDKLKG